MDYKYWNDYYKNDEVPKDASNFAYYVESFIKDNKHLVELGCGNGRDAKFFAKKNVYVTAIDQSDEAIQKLKMDNLDKNTNFICDDFVRTDILNKQSIDYVYSRFTIHSISEEEEDILIKNVFNSLNKGGLFFIEVRSIKDELYALGEEVGRNAYIYNNHYRRFIVIEELVAKLKNIGFEIVFADECNNWAKFKEFNPIVIRIIVKK